VFFFLVLRPSLNAPCCLVSVCTFFSQQLNHVNKTIEHIVGPHDLLSARLLSRARLFLSIRHSAVAPERVGRSWFSFPYLGPRPPVAKQRQVQGAADAGSFSASLPDGAAISKTEFPSLRFGSSPASTTRRKRPGRFRLPTRGLLFPSCQKRGIHDGMGVSTGYPFILLLVIVLSSRCRPSIFFSPWIERSRQFPCPQGLYGLNSAIPFLFFCFSSFFLARVPPFPQIVPPTSELGVAQASPRPSDTWTISPLFEGLTLSFKGSRC